MCGISGYCLNAPIQPSYREIENLLQSIRKRGPDDEGICLISRGQNAYQLYRNGHTHASLGALPHIETGGMGHDLAFLHTRYAILDLSEKGHQPFVSQDGAVIAVFNGEIYNYIELRSELSALGVVFKTRCDTEVLVEGYARWKEALWPKMNGFWSVVLYDRGSRLLVFSRDRMGVAPLYYRQLPQGIYFSSYIEPLIDINDHKAAPDEDAILGFAQTGFKDIAQTSFYSEIKSVPAATTLYLSHSQSDLSGSFVKQYWTFPSQRLQEKDISFPRAVKEFRDIFFNAVDIRLRADVKVAFELSGGLDSSSVVAAASVLNKHKITTYTAKIQGADEEPFARSMLQKYDLDYRVLTHMEDDFARDYAPFSNLMEEPFDNPNAYTHHQMLRIMKSQGVKVVVTGAGGDETLAGYEASFWPKAYQEWKAEGFNSYLRADWYEFCRRYKTVSKSAGTVGNYFRSVFNKLGVNAKCSNRSSMSFPTTASNYHDKYARLSFDEQRRFHFQTALLPFYMRSSDHFTMGIPIEHRFPLLDYRLVEFGLTLPISYLFRNGWTKYILRKAMEPHLPPKIIWRRQKMGFRFPYQRYFRNNAKTFAPLLEECFLSFPRLRVQGGYGALLNKDPILLWRLISIGIWQKGQRP